MKFCIVLNLMMRQNFFFQSSPTTSLCVRFQYFPVMSTAVQAIPIATRSEVAIISKMNNLLVVFAVGMAFDASCVALETLATPWLVLPKINLMLMIYVILSYSFSISAYSLIDLEKINVLRRRLETHDYIYIIC